MLQAVFPTNRILFVIIKFGKSKHFKANDAIILRLIPKVYFDYFYDNELR